MSYCASLYFEGRISLSVSLSVDDHVVSPLLVTGKEAKGNSETNSGKVGESSGGDPVTSGNGDETSEVAAVYTEDDVDMVMMQAGASREKAISCLQASQGDLVSAILDAGM